jgi:poly(A) polymerase
VITVVGALRKSLKMSNEENDAMRQILDGIAPLLADPEPTVAKMKRFLAGSQSGWSRELLQSMGECGYLTDRIHWLQEELAHLEQEDVAPPPLLDGDILTNAGLAPGPIFRRLLDAVYDAQLENRVRKPEEALALALEMAKTL